MNEEQKKWFMQSLDALYPNGHKWLWEDEKLMEAYACKKYMDEFRGNR